VGHGGPKRARSWKRRTEPRKAYSAWRSPLLGDIKCPPSILPREPEPAHRLIETKFLHLRQPVALGECIEGWRVCWLGGWDRGKIFFVMMVSRSVYVTQHK
jgi:hypothetical protein